MEWSRGAAHAAAVGTAAGGPAVPADARAPAAGDPLASAAGPVVDAGGDVADRARRCLEAIRGGIAELVELPVERLSDDGVLALVHEVECATRSFYGAQVRAAAEIEERGIAARYGARSSAHLLRETATITVGQARARLEAARVGLGRDTLTGERIPPVLPELIDAVDAGTISGDHARVITRCLARIPDTVDADTCTTCRNTLLHQAQYRDPNGLQKVADRILAIVTADGDLPDLGGDRAEFHIGHRRGDGLTPVTGLLPPLTAEELRVAINALAAPKPLDDHTPDPRSAPRRRADALAEILHRHLTSTAGPRDGGNRPHVVVTIPLTDLYPTPAGIGATVGAGAGAGAGADTADGAGGGVAELPPPRPGAAWSDYDGPQTAGLARLLACDAQLIPQVLGGDSVVLDQGQAERLFTSAQRRALVTRDRGCAFPGCDTPPAWCEAHHIAWWKRDGGPTDTANGVMLCRRHHTLIHQGRWRIRSQPRGQRPSFIPPPHIDPQQRPRQNHHFHPPPLQRCRTG